MSSSSLLHRRLSTSRCPTRSTLSFLHATRGGSGLTWRASQLQWAAGERRRGATTWQRRCSLPRQASSWTSARASRLGVASLRLLSARPAPCSCASEHLRRRYGRARTRRTATTACALSCHRRSRCAATSARSDIGASSATAPQVAVTMRGGVVTPPSAARCCTRWRRERCFCACVHSYAERLCPATLPASRHC